MPSNAAARLPGNLETRLAGITQAPKKRRYRRAITVADTGVKTADAFAASAKVQGRWSVRALPDISDLEVRFLQHMISDNGSRRVAVWAGVSESVILRVAAHCGHKCRPDAMEKIRAFFAESDLRSVERRPEQSDLIRNLEAAKRGRDPGRDSPQKRGTKTDATREVR
jgi:hypothetical protein